MATHADGSNEHGRGTTTTPAGQQCADPVELDPKRWWALTVISIATLMVVLDASIINIALPDAQAALGISDAHRQWAVTAYALTFGGLLLLGGRVVDFVGRKRAFLVGLIGFAVASMVAGIAMNGATLFAGRALQGAFAALLAPAALSLIAVTFTDATERAKAFGVYGALQGAGGAIGLIAGGVLTEYASWRWCLFVNTPVAIAAALAATSTVRESRADGPRRYDVPGAVLVTGSLVALVWGFTHAAEASWGAPLTWGLLALGVALLVAFVVVEARSSHPLLPLRVVWDRDRGGAFLASLLVGAAMFGLMLFLTYYLQVNLGYAPLQAGLAFLPFSVGIIAAATFGAGLVPQAGPRLLMVVGLVLTVVGTIVLLFVRPADGYALIVLPAMVLTGLGLGVFFVALPNIALAGIDPADTGVASAMVSTTQQVGGAIGPALLNTLYISGVTSALASSEVISRTTELQAYVDGYRVAFVASIVIFLAALIAVALILRASQNGAGTAEMPADTAASNH